MMMMIPVIIISSDVIDIWPPGGNVPTVWEDITGSPSLNIVNNSLSFSTTVSARLGSLTLNS